jgi:RNA polymerase sigma-70 factor (ECF subfamily)
MKENADLARLVRRAGQGDTGAFTALVRATEDLVARVAYRMLLDPHDAEEVVQEVFMDAHRKLPDWEEGARFTTWLYRATTLAALAHRRASGRYRDHLAGAATAARPSLTPPPAPGEQLEAQETRERIQRAVARLPAGQRETFVLRHFEGLPLAEIAAIRGVALGTVKAQLSQAVASLRRLLTGALPCQSREVHP